jgi:hypothetical protein
VLATFRKISLAFTATEWLIVVGSLAVWSVIVAGGYLFVPDDVYFYLHIADEISTGHGSTFNEIVPTNGYHPLWMGVCVLLRIVVAGRQHLAQCLFTVCAALHVVSLWLLARVLTRVEVRHRWPALLLLAYYLVNNAAGSELHLRACLPG